MRRLIGSARLAVAPDGESAEFAVLVADPWQGRGLGDRMLQYCTELGQRWGLKKIVAETTGDNVRMLAIFRRHQFQIETSSGHEILLRKMLKDAPGAVEAAAEREGTAGLLVAA
jgi:acetyltransferase